MLNPLAQPAAEARGCLFTTPQPPRQDPVLSPGGHRETGRAAAENDSNPDWAETQLPLQNLHLKLQQKDDSLLRSYQQLVYQSQ